MAAVRPSFFVHDFPTEMVDAVVVDAARDAVRVVWFLEQLELGATPETPLSMPAGFLLHPGAALRLLACASLPASRRASSSTAEHRGDKLDMVRLRFPLRRWQLKIGRKIRDPLGHLFLLIPSSLSGFCH